MKTLHITITVIFVTALITNTGVVLAQYGPGFSPVEHYPPINDTALKLLVMNSTEFKERTIGYNYTLAGIDHNWISKGSNYYDFGGARVTFFVFGFENGTTKGDVFNIDSQMKIKTVFEYNADNPPAGYYTDRCMGCLLETGVTKPKCCDPYVPMPITTPLKQFRSGIAVQDVKCREDLILVIKTEDGYPACVTSQTAQKLVERGWTTSTTDLKPWTKIDTLGLNVTYVVNQPISFSVAVKGFGNYPCVSPQIKIHDNKNPNVPVFQDNGSTMSCPALRTPDNYSFDFPGSNSHYVIILNKTGDYTMTISYGDNSVQKYFSIVLPSNQQNATILENNAGIVLLNQPYYFETPNYTNDAYTHPVQVSFHDVLFTLFPPGFRGGLPSGGCGSDGTVGKIVSGGGTYYWADAKFSDGIHELLHMFADSNPCPIYPKQTMFSNHTNPQAGLTFYDGKMKLLVSADYQISSSINYTKESGITDDATYLSQTIDEWKSKTPEQLRAYYIKYKDAFYDELGSFLIKDEMKKELARQKIQNIHDDFKVFPGMSLDSLPPHISYDAVVNATDGNSYLLLGGVFANKIESSPKIIKLVFDKNALHSLSTGNGPSYPDPSTNAHVDNSTSQEKVQIAGTYIEDSDIPWSSVGTGNYGVIQIGLYTSVYHMIPDAQKYYTARAMQLIPFYVPVKILPPPSTEK